MTIAGEDDGKGGVRVTNAAIYTAVVEMGGSVRDLAGKVGELIRRDDDADALHKDHEDRLRSLETWKAEAEPKVAEVSGLLAARWKLAGIGASVTLLIGSSGYFVLTQIVHR